MESSHFDLDQELYFEDWGLIDYEVAQSRQLEVLEKVHQRKSLGVIVFCTHPPIVTLGRQSQESDLCGWTGPLYQSTRGGRATYHGPSQIVIYFILNLHHPQSRALNWEVVNFLRAVENILINTLDLYGIKASPHPTAAIFESDPSVNSPHLETGVWVGQHKIASLGIAVKKWITYHGLAVNIDHDPKAFVGLNPCGYKASIMTNLQTLLQKPVPLFEFKERFKKEFIKFISVKNVQSNT